MLVSQVVRKLGSKEVLARRTSSVDTRARAVSLTEEGVRRLTATLGVVEACDAEFFAAADGTGSAGRRPANEKGRR